MSPFIEVLLVIVIVGFVVWVFGSEIYKKMKNKPTGECECCAMKNKRILNKIKKQIAVEKNKK